MSFQTEFIVNEIPEITTPKPAKKTRRPKKRRDSSEFEYEFVVQGAPTEKVSFANKLTSKLDSRPAIDRSVPSSFFSSWSQTPQPAKTNAPSWSLQRAVTSSIGSAYNTFRHPILTAHQVSSTVRSVGTSTSNALSQAKEMLEKLVDKEWCRKHKFVAVLLLLGLAACCAVGLWGLVAVVVGFAFVGLFLWTFFL